MSSNPDLDLDLDFDTDGWAEGTSPDGGPVFLRAPDDVLIARAFDVPPDIGAPVADLEGIYDHFRAPLAEAGASLVSLGALAVDGVPALELIFSAPQESPAGTVYVGVLTIPFRDESFVLKVMCGDAGIADDPLTRVRRHLARLEATTTLSERAKQMPRFGD